MKKLKLISIIIIILMAFVFSNNASYALAGWSSEVHDAAQESGGATGTGMPTYKDQITDPIQNPDKYKPTQDTSGASKLKNMANDLIGALKALGTILAVVILIIMGYKYMIGSVSERADYKKSMIPYLIGAIMLFAIPNMVGIIYDLVKGIKF